MITASPPLILMPHASYDLITGDCHMDVLASAVKTLPEPPKLTTAKRVVKKLAPTYSEMYLTA